MTSMVIKKICLDIMGLFKTSYGFLPPYSSNNASTRYRALNIHYYSIDVKFFTRISRE